MMEEAVVARCPNHLYLFALVLVANDGPNDIALSDDVLLYLMVRRQVVQQELNGHSEFPLSSNITSNAPLST